MQFLVSTSLSSFGVLDLPYDLNSLLALKRTGAFQFVQLFSCEKRVMTS